MTDGGAAPDMGVLLQLQFTPLFSGLAPDDVRDLLHGAEVVSVPPETVLYDVGVAVEHFYVILDGHVELSVDTEGRRSVVEVARKGGLLGEIAMFSGGLTVLRGRVLTPARLLRVPAASFRAKLEKRFDILLHMLSTMSVRLRMLVRQIAELKLKTTAQRLGSFLLSQTAAEDGPALVRFPYDKKLVADELGMKPESLSRALAKLAKAGVDSRPDGTVAIADLDDLRAFCSEEEAL